MTGPELSVFALCDGNDAMPFAEAQDHKRAFDNDEGGNTGGMGAYSPVPWVPETLVDEVMAKAVHPTLNEMRARDASFRGLLYCGLMLTAEGPKIVEYNVRFGDPECQVLLPRLESDLYAHCRESAEGRLTTPVRMHDDAVVCIALAAEGYPPAPLRKGEDVITGIEQAQRVDGALVFHYATKLVDGALTTNGGRVLTVVGRGPDVRAARDCAYEAAACISWNGLHYRRDIAAQALT
jgi:phosphoribosylamine--glycine ligase